jgi:hypothetical protein
VTSPAWPNVRKTTSAVVSKERLPKDNRLIITYYSRLSWPPAGALLPAPMSSAPVSV